MSLIGGVIQKVREAANRTSCQNNLKQIGLGVHNFHNSFNFLPVSKMDDSWGTWATLILPYLEGDNAFRLWEPQKRYYNQTPEARMHHVKIYFCPSRRGVPGTFSVGDQRTSGVMFPDTPGGLSDYAACVGTNWAQRNGAITDGEQRVIIDPRTGARVSNVGATSPPDALLISWKSRTRFLNIVDGTSNTLMIGEKHIRLTTQTGRNEDRSVYNGEHETGAVGREAGRGVNDDGVTELRPLVSDPRDTVDAADRFGGRHPGVCQFVFCDGSVHAIRTSIDIETLTRLADRADGLPVTGDF
jgi:prepilin-type processing-associated H-X9-DG protein